MFVCHPLFFFSFIYYIENKYKKKKDTSQIQNIHKHTHKHL